MLLQGLFVPLTSPFYRDGTSYLRKLEHNVRRYSLGPAAGLVTLSPGMEAASLTDLEAYETLRSVCETAAKEKVLIAGVERNSVHAALKLAEIAAETAFDAVLLAPPTDWPRLVTGEDARELLTFYKAVADRSPLPIVLWSDATAPSLSLPLTAIASLARHPNVIGLVDRDLDAERLQCVLAETAEIRREVSVTTIFEAVTRRMTAVANISPAPTAQTLVSIGGISGDPVAANVAPVAALKTRTKTVAFQVLAGGAAQLLPAFLTAGASGGLPMMAACAPQGCFEVYAAWKDGDLPLAAQRGTRLQAAEQLFGERGIAALKYACDWNGFYGGIPRLPRLPLTAEERGSVEVALGEVRN